MLKKGNHIIRWGMACTIFLSLVAHASKLTQAEYNIQVKGMYRELERLQLDLNRSLDQKKHPKVLIEKSCVYVTQLKKLEALSLENLALNKAQEDAQFIGGLIQDFDQSFADLGTTYQKSCQRNSRE